MLWQPLTKIVNDSLSSLITKNLIEIIRELNKEFLMYFYTIYTISTWSILTINSLTYQNLFIFISSLFYFLFILFSYFLILNLGLELA